MTNRNLFNKLARAAKPLAVAFTLAIGVTGCAVSPPQTQMGPDNIAYIQQGISFYRQTGASPVNYDACGALRNAVQGNGNSQVGTLAGGALAGIAVDHFTSNPLLTAAGVIGGAVVGGSTGKYAQTGTINQLNKDCQLQQAISRESGGTVRGGSVTYQPGGIYQNNRY